MANRIQQILIRARDTLADQDKERWSDARLLRILDEGQKDLAIHTRLLNGQVVIPVTPGQHTYPLPTDVYLITRATFNDYEVELATYDQMDEQAAKSVLADRRHESSERIDRYNNETYFDYNRIRWEVTEGDQVEYVIYDKRNLSEIRVYPIPNESIVDYDYTFNNSGYTDFVGFETNSDFGVLVTPGEADTLTDVFGVVTAAESVILLVTDPDSCDGVENIQQAEFDTVFGTIDEIIDLIPRIQYHGDDTTGVIVNIDDYTTDSVFGVATTMFDPAISSEQFTQDFGIVTDVAQNVESLRLFYIRYPKVISDITDTLETPSAFDTALKHYVIANCFRDDIDTQRQELAAQSYQLYERELMRANEVSRRDGVRKTAHETTYRSGFE